MTMLPNVPSHQEQGPMTAGCPHPVSLETMELIQQTLAQAVRSLRRGARDAAAEAGRIEYESWLPRSH